MSPVPFGRCVASVRYTAAAADDERDQQGQGKHRKPHPVFIDEVGHRDEREEERADVGHEDADQGHDPQQ